MRALKQKPPSEAQARALAKIWVGQYKCRLSNIGNTDPTEAVLKREGWIVPDGTTGQWPNGQTYHGQKVSPEGLAALENYLCSVRVKNENH